MVITNSDSNTTLVSLNDNPKHGTPTSDPCIVIGQSGLLEFVEPSLSTTDTTTSAAAAARTTVGVPTDLWIATSGEARVPLYLPTPRDPITVDEYLSETYYAREGHAGHEEGEAETVTGRDLRTGARALCESRNRLLSAKRRTLGAATETPPTTASTNPNESSHEAQHRLLYVAQGERANATQAQYDVLASDKATTCHILAFRSSCNSDGSSECHRPQHALPLASITHLDGPNYEECVRDMIQEHIDHHSHRCEGDRSNHTCFDRRKSKRTRCGTSNDSGGITIEVHVVGGFDDCDGSSSDITDWLLRLLANLAGEHGSKGVEMVVKTLAVSSSNNAIDRRGNHTPIGRGLGIDVRSGEVFLASCEHDAMGPAHLLRSVRLWSRCSQEETGGDISKGLSVVHRSSDAERLLASVRGYGLFWVRPFVLRAIPDARALLGLPDELLRMYTSTSPEVEEEGFCRDVRDSLSFLERLCVVEGDDGSKLFGKAFDRPLVFGIYRGGEGAPGSGGKASPKKGEWQLLSP